MSSKHQKAIAKAESLGDALAEDLLGLPDADLAEEMEKFAGSVDVAAKKFDEIFAAAQLRAGRERMALAKSAVQSAKQMNAGNVIRLPIERKRAILAQHADDAGIDRKLTMAARNAGEMSEQDLDSLLEDLLALGIIDSQGEGK